MDVIIVGSGIAALTLALSLDQAGISSRVYEAVADLAPLGVGTLRKQTPKQSARDVRARALVFTVGYETSARKEKAHECEVLDRSYRDGRGERRHCLGADAQRLAHRNLDARLEHREVSGRT